MDTEPFLAPKMVGQRFEGHAIPLELLRDLAVLEEMVVSPADAWKHFIDGGSESKGVQAVTFAECAGEQLPARPSPRDDSPHHAEIDFSGYSNNRCDKKGKRLRALAEIRGWLYQD
jgi:hypothetical protein